MSTETTVEIAYGAGGYGQDGYGEPFSDELGLKATANLVSTDNVAELAIWGTALDRITVTGLWMDWTVTNHQAAGSTFTDAIEETGTVYFEWSETATDVEPSLTFEMPDQYVGGQFEMSISGTDGTDSVPAEVTIDLDGTF